MTGKQNSLNKPLRTLLGEAGTTGLIRADIPRILREREIFYTEATALSNAINYLLDSKQATASGNRLISNELHLYTKLTPTKINPPRAHVTDMDDEEKQPRPTIEESVYWGEVVLERLATAVHVYGHPPHDKPLLDTIPDIIDLIREIFRWTHTARVKFSITQAPGIPYQFRPSMVPIYNRQLPKTAAQVIARTYRAYDQDPATAGAKRLVNNHWMTSYALSAVFERVLDRLPFISKDIQRLLRSRWENNCNGGLATEFFMGRESELQGVGSGIPKHGRLPSVLRSFVEAVDFWHERDGEDAPTVSHKS